MSLAIILFLEAQRKELLFLLESGFHTTLTLRFLARNISSSPGWVAQLVRASSQYIKVVGSIPGQGTDKNQLANAEISRTTNRCLFLSLSLPPTSSSLSQINQSIKKWVVNSKFGLDLAIMSSVSEPYGIIVPLIFTAGIYINNMQIMC